MAKRYNSLEEWSEDFERAYLDCIEEVDNEQEAALEEMKRMMLKRIHQDGIASDGAKINSRVTARTRRPGGVYSSTHEDKRRAIGRQVGFIDLRFTGDLEDSLVVCPDGQNIALGFRTIAAALKAKYAEQYRKKDIWAPTTNELNHALDFLGEGIEAKYDKCLP